MAKFKLTSGAFTLMSEGRKVIKVKSAEGKPSANPKDLEVVFVDAAGATLHNTYTLDERNEKGAFVTSLFLQGCLGDIEEFDIADIPTLVGKYLDVEIKHTEVESKKDPSKTLTFANVGRIYGAGEPFETPQAETVQTQPANNRPML
jgi:hypothetical protein